ncbi:hypothetical protein D3C81_2143100 [compost metagenome]
MDTGRSMGMGKNIAAGMSMAVSKRSMDVVVATITTIITTTTMITMSMIILEGITTAMSMSWYTPGIFRVRWTARPSKLW